MTTEATKDAVSAERDALFAEIYRDDGREPRAAETGQLVDALILAAEQRGREVGLAELAAADAESRKYGGWAEWVQDAVRDRDEAQRQLAAAQERERVLRECLDEIRTVYETGSFGHDKAHAALDATRDGGAL